MPPSEPLSLRRALALGLLQGPTELLPVSSSSHTALAQIFLARTGAALPAPERRAFEVALHGASALGLATQARTLTTRAPLRALLPAVALPAALGYAFEERIDRRLSGPGAVACAMVAGAAGMALAQRRPPRAQQPTRSVSEAGLADGLLLGAIQSLALVPGISRHGAVLSAARARGFPPAEAAALSWTIGLPVIAGASLLKALRFGLRRGLPADPLALAGGASAAFSSSALCARLRIGTRAAQNLMPYAIYRGLVGAGALLRLARISASAQSRSSSSR
jgi:undecaprenyl-diphosphatase